MSDKVTVGKRCASLLVSDKLAKITGVSLVGNETTNTAGDSTGRVVSVPFGFGTNSRAKIILNKIKGFEYQPYTATGCLMDPAAEIGDGVAIGRIYSGIYSVDWHFGRIMTADISAKNDEEIDHEYPCYADDKNKYVTKKELAGGGGGHSSGGTGLVKSSAIDKNAVTAYHLMKGSVVAEKIGPKAVANYALDDEAVHESNLTAGSVTRLKIGNGAVGTSQIGGGQVTPNKCNQAINDTIATAAEFTKLCAGTITVNYISASYIRGSKYLIQNQLRSLSVRSDGVVTAT